MRIKGYLLLIMMVLAGLVILASSLSELKLNTGQLFNQATRSELRQLFAQFNAYRGVLIVCVGIIPLILILFAWISRPRSQRPTGSRRSNSIFTLLQLIIFAIALILLRRKILENTINLLSPKSKNPQDFFAENSIDQIIIDTPEFLKFMVGFVLLIGLIMVILWIISKRAKPGYSLERLAFEAQVALDEIESGADLRNVILNCYHQMTQAIEIHRGVRRPMSMTPKEFELRMIGMGLPQKSIQQLTQLFEEVRYGAKEVGPESEDIARTSLTEIVTACNEAG